MRQQSLILLQIPRQMIHANVILSCITILNFPINIQSIYFNSILLGVEFQHLSPKYTSSQSIKYIHDLRL